MKVQLAFEQDEPPDLDITTTGSYQTLKGLGLPESDCRRGAAEDYRRRFVVNPGYEPNWIILSRARSTQPQRFKELLEKLHEEDAIRKGPYWYEI